MRVLMTTTGYPGHVLPLVPFARAFADAGHDVCVAGPRSSGEMATRAGLAFTACGEPSPEDVGRIVGAAAALPPDEGHARIVAEGFARICARVALPDMLRVVGAWRPDVVVRESQEFAACLAAERHGVPHVRVALGLASTEEETFSLAAGPVDELRAELGLPADPHAERLRAAPQLTLVPPALEPPGAIAPPATHRFRIGRDDTPPLPDWWSASADPLVYVTFGSVAGSLGLFPALYRAVIDAIADVPARVLVTTGVDSDPADLGPVPDNVHVERWVPQETAVAHADAVVCHGGYGSALGALAEGLPLVIVPLFSSDQWENARRLAAVGAGIALAGAPRAMFDLPGPDVIAGLPEAVEHVLTDRRHRDAARRLADDIAALPPVTAAVDAVLSP